MGDGVDRAANEAKEKSKLMEIDDEIDGHRHCMCAASSMYSRSVHSLFASHAASHV